MSDAYTDPCYGVKMTHVFPVPFGGAMDSATGEAINPEAGGSSMVDILNMFRMPFKAKLNKFGLIVRGASNLGCSTDTCFGLKYLTGTMLASFDPGGAAAADLATQLATGVAPAVATNIPINRIVVPFISKEAKVAEYSTFMCFMEYSRVYDGGA